MTGIPPWLFGHLKSNQKQKSNEGYMHQQRPSQTDVFSFFLLIYHCSFSVYKFIP